MVEWNKKNLVTVPIRVYNIVGKYREVNIPIKMDNKLGYKRLEMVEEVSNVRVITINVE